MTGGGAGGGGAVAAFDGGEDGGVLADGEGGGDALVAVVEAGFEEVGERVQEEGADLIAGGGGEEAVEGHVRGDGVGGGGGVEEVIVGGAEGIELGGSGAPGGETGVFGLDDEAELDELAKAVHLVGHEEVEGVAEGFMEAVDGANAEALADFEEALLLQTFGRLAHHAAGDAELGGEVALGGKERLVWRAGAREVGESLADFFDKGGGAVDGGEGHGVAKIRWSDQWTTVCAGEVFQRFGFGLSCGVEEWIR
jgi:hypothetical protein